MAGEIDGRLDGEWPVGHLESHMPLRGSSLSSARDEPRVFWSLWTTRMQAAKLDPRLVSIISTNQRLRIRDLLWGLMRFARHCARELDQLMDLECDRWCEARYRAAHLWWLSH